MHCRLLSLHPSVTNCSSSSLSSTPHTSHPTLTTPTTLYITFLSFPCFIPHRQGADHSSLPPVCLLHVSIPTGHNSTAHLPFICCSPFTPSFYFTLFAHAIKKKKKTSTHVHKNDMSVSLPVLSNPCIAAASSTSVYLIGIPSALGGHLQVFSITLDTTLDSPVAVPIGKEQVTNTWDVQANMACFSYGAITSPHGTVLLVQVGKTRTDIANLRSSGVFDNPVQIPDSTLKSTKLLTQVGAYSTFAWFMGFTTTNTASPWKGMRFLSTNVSAYISE